MFDEFALYVAPAVHVAGGVNVRIDAAISSEFANVVYRFGHSMLDENIPPYQLGADGKPVIGADGQPVMTQEGLIQAFTDPNMTADIVLGTVNRSAPRSTSSSRDRCRTTCSACRSTSPH